MIESTSRDDISACAEDWWGRVGPVDPVAAMLTVGSRLNEHVKRLASGSEARLALATLTHRDLAAMALTAAYQFRQLADPEVWGDYGDWCCRDALPDDL